MCGTLFVRMPGPWLQQATPGWLRHLLIAEALAAAPRSRCPRGDFAEVEAGVFELPFRLAASALPVRALLRKYARVPMDVADACLVHLADAASTGQVLTLDSDFRIYRWRGKRPFELLLE
jgi:hypothetical protein